MTKTSLISTVSLTASTETRSPCLMFGKATRQIAMNGQYKRLKKPFSSITSRLSEDTHFSRSFRYFSSLLINSDRFHNNLYLIVMQILVAHAIEVSRSPYDKNHDCFLSLRCATRLFMNRSEPTLRSRKVSI